MSRVPPKPAEQDQVTDCESELPEFSRFGDGLQLLADGPWALMRDALDGFEPGVEWQREQPEQADREDLLP